MRSAPTCWSAPVAAGRRQMRTRSPSRAQTTRPRDAFWNEGERDSRDESESGLEVQSAYTDANIHGIPHGTFDHRSVYLASGGAFLDDANNVKIVILFSDGARLMWRSRRRGPRSRRYR